MADPPQTQARGGITWPEMAGLFLFTIAILGIILALTTQSVGPPRGQDNAPRMHTPAQDR